MALKISKSPWQWVLAGLVAVVAALGIGSKTKKDADDKKAKETPYPGVPPGIQGGKR